MIFKIIVINIKYKIKKKNKSILLHLVIYIIKIWLRDICIIWLAILKRLQYN